ncbi:MAG TPA: large-conductance mechanosensitive channel protein MscL [Candidatus Nanoarchaeia archaeon]|nr:large-conductance mechanosensitive channel protein MscL [Candidatus Nanoarchaeia archaeon]
MGFVKEFKEFAMRGNVVDMAIGIIIGAAFGKIISSFVTDVIMPPIGLLLGGVDFTRLMIVLKPEVAATATAAAVPAVAIRYGLFMNTIIDFVIIALAIFMVIKGINKMKKKQEAKAEAPPKPTEEVLLLRDIRNSLKKSK